MSFPRYGPAAAISAIGAIGTTASIALNVVKNTCTEDENVGKVSWLYGPGIWSAWALTATVVLVTNECDLSSKLVLSSSSIKALSNSPVTDQIKDKEVGENNDVWEHGQQASQSPGVDLEVTFVTGYSVLTALHFIYQLSLGKRSAELEATLAIAYASSIIVTTLNSLSNYRTTWFRRFLWFLMGYLCSTVHCTSVAIRDLAFETIYLAVGSCFRYLFHLLLLLYMPFTLDPQRRKQIPGDGWSGLLLVLAWFPYFLTPTFLVLYWVTSSDGFKKYEESPCTTFGLTNIVPRTGSSLTDPEQAVALCVALLNASRSLYRWWYSY